MSAALIMTMVLSAGSLFEVQTFPLENPDAYCFIAETDDDDPAASLLILDGFILRIYKNAREGQPRIIELPSTATAIDIADLDGDGMHDVIIVCHEKILRYDLAEPEAVPTTLFRLSAPLSLSSTRPFPFVIVIKRDGVPLLALPAENTFELRAINGDLAASYPIGSNAPRHAAYGRPFTAFNIDPPQAGPPGGLEMRITRMLAYIPDLPEDILPVDTPLPFYRRGTPSQTHNAAKLEAEGWPWFPLKRDGTRAAKVLYALDSPESAQTLIRIQEPAPGAEGLRAEVRTGPERRYPGMLLFPENALPDFNNDGFVDLVLWTAPEPAPTVGALTRAALSGVWPIRVTVHLFDSQTRRYAPSPVSRIEMNVPVSWFLSVSGAPLRHIVFSDFDGDGRTGFGCSPSPDLFSVWRFGEKGFGAKPDFQYRFDEPVQRLEFQAVLDGTGRTSLGLRTDTALYVLIAAATPPPAKGLTVKE